MRNLLLAAAFALGLGFAATGAQAAAIGSNVAGIEAAAKIGNPVVEKTYYRRGWGHRRYWGHRRWRGGYYHRGWGRGYYHRGWGWRHHRYWRYHHRRHYWR